jgi:hypothetical protein
MKSIYLAVVALSLCSLIQTDCTRGGGSEVVLPVEVVHQHKDTAMVCPHCSVSTPHADDHAIAGDDTVYFNGDECSHCSTYCAPAAIAMIAEAYGLTGFSVEQDTIYESGKEVGETAPGDGAIETHGVGMFDGTGGRPREVQNALTWALKGIQFDEYGPATQQITAQILKDAVVDGRSPVLWLDHRGWPAHQSGEYPPPALRNDQGHAKVVGGYDHGDTEETADDRCLIFDPWPEYSHLSVMPQSATVGPGGSCNPYWLPLSDTVQGDPDDVFLIPKDALPE